MTVTNVAVIPGRAHPDRRFAPSGHRLRARTGTHVPGRLLEELDIRPKTPKQEYLGPG